MSLLFALFVSDYKYEHFKNFAVLPRQRGGILSQPKLPKKSNLQKYKTMSLNLRYFRNRLELTQEQVASRAGISTKYLSLIESAAFCNPPTLEVLFDLSDALEIEPYRIFKEL